MPVCDECADVTATDSPHAKQVRVATAQALAPEERMGRQQAEDWLEVSRAATGHETFYLPGSPPFRFKRSEADLNESFAVEPSFLGRCLSELNAERIFGLTHEAVRHLQRTFELFMARHPRDDHAWPSREDLELKLVWLSLEIDRGGDRVREYRAERDRIVDLFAKITDPW